MPRTCPRRKRALAAVLALLACSPDLPATRWMGKFLHFATDLDATICEGTFPVQDRFIELLAGEFAAEIESPIPLVFLSPGDVDDACDLADSYGCYTDGRAYTMTPFQLHELTHAVADAADWNGPTSFAEGLAGVYSTDAWASVTRVPVEEGLRSFDFSHDHYYTMALFVRFLIERHGLAPLGAFMAATDKRDDFDSFAPVFAQHFGEPLDAAVLAFDDYPTCSAWENRIALVECAQPELPWDGLSWTAEVELSCTSDDVIGPLDDNDAPLMATTRTLVVEADIDALAVVDFQGGGLAGARITRCGSCWDALDLQIPAGTATNISLPAGRYYVWFLAEAETSGTMSLSLTR
ncbi:MAG TPA: hypothetical protein PKW35_01070 [Nannocystaceae bacterium]|nr:hypothetical protein [Nannocystaceae bacterium]